METHPKLRRVPTMFCGSRSISDVINKSIAVPLHRPLPSVCRPSAASATHSHPYLPEPTTPVTISDILQGRFCPSAAPPSPPPRHLLNQKTQTRQSTKKNLLATSVCFSDDDERETDQYEVDEEEEEDDDPDTLFSSGSFSSDSSAVILSRRRRTVYQTGVDMKGSFAVVKKSSDPSADFRRSMVEMIVEKEMFALEELERLLQCFLSLNSPCHHGVIVEVFTEIWEAMFTHG